MDNDLKEYIKNTKNVYTKNYDIHNSYGVRDAFNYYRSIKPKNSKYVLTDCEYYKIIRTINNLICDDVSKGYTVFLPSKMGRIYCIEYPGVVRYNGNKLYTNYPIDWNSTLKLWYEDPESRNNKTLIRTKNKIMYRIKWDRGNALFNNKTFYEFRFNRVLKTRLKQFTKEEKINAYLM